MKVRFTETALAEAEEILSHIAKDNAATAAKLAAALDRTISWIARWPNAPPVVFGEDVRAKLVSGYQIMIFYNVKEGEIIVRNIRSTRRLRPWEGDR